MYFFCDINVMVWIYDFVGSNLLYPGSINRIYTITDSKPGADLKLFICEMW